MNLISKYILFLLILFCNIIFFNNSFANTKNLSLDEILEISLNDEIKSKEIDANTGIEWLGFIPNISPWQTDIDSSFERLWGGVENPGMDITYNTFNFDSRLTQETPLGLSLNLNFQQLLSPPDAGFLTREQLSANLLFSLYNDFFGSKTKSILNKVNEKEKEIFNQKNLIQSCEQIANQFFLTFSNENSYLINKEAVKDINFIQNRLRQKSISPQDYLSLSIDKAQLENQIVKTKQQFQSSQLALSDLTRLNIEDLKALSLNENIDDILAKQSKQVGVIDQINLEISLLEAKKSLLDINQNNDVSLFAGYRANDTVGFSKTRSEVIGLNIKWNFGNEQMKNSKKSLDYEISKRKIQRDHILTQQKTILENFNKAIRDQVNSIKVMKQAERNADKLQALSKKSFLNGRIGFFEFLTFRNQANSVKNEYLQTLIDFYKVILEQAVYFGDVNAACFLKNRAGVN